MFATSSRAHRHARPNLSDSARQEAASPPPPGSDSCFGVRSLNGSVAWGAEIEGVPTPPSPLEAHGGEEDTLLGDIVHHRDTEVDPAVLDAGSEHPAEAAVTAPSGTSIPPSLPTSHTRATIRPSSAPAPIRVPSPAIFLLPEPSSAVHTPPQHSPSTTSPIDHSPSAISDYSTGVGGEGDGSAPPSPTSLPSYLASEMSMSMPSSPGLGYSTDPGSGSGSGSGEDAGLRMGMGGVLQALALERERARSGVSRKGTVGGGEGEAGSTDLVIPTLSLPSSSLHLSLRPYRGPVDGLKIALLGEGEEVKAFLRALEDKEELVQVGRQVGVVRGGKLEVVLLTGMSQEQITQRAIAGYSGLHGLLNPSAAEGDQGKLREMVARYADQEDWVHAALDIAGDAQTGLRSDSLDGLVDMLPRSAIPLSPMGPTESSPVTVPVQSPSHGMDDPTPMPHAESSSYFSHPITSAQPISPIPESPALPASISASVQALQSALDSPSALSASIDHFLAWRPAPSAPNLESSDSSLDNSSKGTGTGTSSSGAAGLDGGGQMEPTVGRAQGGEEWEAGLSRRVAKRRESGAGTKAVEKTASKRRRSKGARDGASALGGMRPMESIPLFPPTASSSRPSAEERSGRGLSSPEGGVGLGVRGMLEKTFRPLREGLRGWKRVLVVAAIMGVVGWGWWAGGR